MTSIDNYKLRDDRPANLVRFKINKKKVKVLIATRLIGAIKADGSAEPPEFYNSGGAAISILILATAAP